MSKTSIEDPGFTPEAIKTETAVALVLDDFSTLDTAVMEIVPPGLGRAIGSITFAGPGHPKTQRWNGETYERQQMEARQQRLNPRWEPREKTREEQQEENSKWLVSRMVNWDIKGRAADGSIVDVTYSDAAAMKLLLDPTKGWLFGDALAFIGRIENFMSSSSKT